MLNLVSMTDESIRKKANIFSLLILKRENAYAKIGLLPILWTLCDMDLNTKEIIYYN